MSDTAGPARGGREHRLLAQSVHIAEEGSPGLIRRAAATAGAAALALTAWAGFIPIDEELTAAGETVPVGEAQIIRHPDGGKVAEVLVSDGDVVEVGQILIRFSPDDVEARLKRAAAERAEVGLLTASLKALESGGEPDFAFALPKHQDLVARERVVFGGLRQLTDKRRRQLKADVSETELRLRGIEAREKKLDKEADLLEEEMLLRRELLKKGLAAKEVHEKAKREVDKAHRKLAALADARRTTAQQLKDARKKASELENRLKQRALDELALATEKRQGLDGALEELKQQMIRLQVAAPAKGLVRGAGRHTLGATVAPGTVIGEIVPFSGDATVEVRIPVAQVERVDAGQKVTVRIKGEGFARYGAVAGTLAEISPEPVDDGKRRPFHKGTVILDRDRVGKGAQAHRILPGMKVTARVKTGSSILLARLLGL